MYASTISNLVSTFPKFRNDAVNREDDSYTFYKDAAEKAADSLENGVAYQVDVTDEEVIKSAIADIRSKYGEIDVLVNNAGIQFISKVSIAYR